MKVETIKVVNAYKALKEMKVSDMSDDEMVAVWDNLKSFRKVSENYDKDVSDRNTSLIDDKVKEMSERRIKALQLENDEKAGKYKRTAKDIQEVQELNMYFNSFNSKYNKVMKDLADQKIEVKVSEIDSKEFIKAFKQSGKTMGEIMDLEWLTK